MSFYLALAVGFVGALLQSSILDEYSVAGVHVDVVMVCVVAWSLLHGPRQALLWAIVGGLCLDFFSAGPFGGSMLALLAAALVAQVAGVKARSAQPYLVVLAVPAAALVFFGVAASIDALARGQLGIASLLVGVILPAVAVDSIFGALVLIPGVWLARVFERNPYL